MKTYTRNSAQQVAYEQLQAQVLNAPEVQAFMARTGCSEHTIKQQVTMVSTWLTRIRQLDQETYAQVCQDPQRTYWLDLDYDAQAQLLSSVARLHPRLVEHQERLAYQRYFLVNDLGSAYQGRFLDDINTSGVDRGYIMATTRIIEALEQTQGLYLYGARGREKHILWHI